MGMGGNVYTRLSPLSLVQGWGHSRLASLWQQTRSHEDHLASAPTLQSPPLGWCVWYSGKPDSSMTEAHTQARTRRSCRDSCSKRQGAGWPVAHTKERRARRSVMSAQPLAVPGVSHQPSEQQKVVAALPPLPKHWTHFPVANINPVKTGKEIVEKIFSA